jgi:P27 family predicted phage terminase small subunit
MPKIVKLPRKQGRPRKPRLPPSDLLSKLPNPPEWLSSEARMEWRRTGALLVARHQLTAADLVPLEAYCAAKGRLVEAERTIKKDGLIIGGSHGGQVANPACAIAGEASRSLKSLALLLGLRRKGQNEEAAQDDRWEGLIDG